MREGKESVNHPAELKMDRSEDHRAHLVRHLTISEVRSHKILGENFRSMSLGERFYRGTEDLLQIEGLKMELLLAVVR